MLLDPAPDELAPCLVDEDGWGIEHVAPVDAALKLTSEDTVLQPADEVDRVEQRSPCGWVLAAHDQYPAVAEPQQLRAFPVLAQVQPVHASGRLEEHALVLPDSGLVRTVVKYPPVTVATAGT